MGGRDSHGFSEINVTPLTDVLLVLLIIFLLTASSLTVSNPDLELPRVVTRSQLERQELVLEIDHTGTAVMEGRGVTPAQLAERLGQRRSLVVAADRRTPFAAVRPFLVQLSENQVEVQLATELEPDERP